MPFKHIIGLNDEVLKLTDLPTLICVFLSVYIIIGTLTRKYAKNQFYKPQPEHLLAFNVIIW